MNYLKRAWLYLALEPFIWLFCCLFQPAKFKEEFNKEDLKDRIKPMLRLILPIFVVSVYPFFFFVISLGGLFGLDIISSAYLFVAAVWSTFPGIVIGIVWGILVDMATGIFSGILLGIGLGFLWRNGLDVGLTAEVSIALGIGLFIFGDFIGPRAKHILGSTVVGAVVGIIYALWYCLLLTFVGGLAGILVGGVIWGFSLNIAPSILGGTIVGIMILTYIIWDMTWNNKLRVSKRLLLQYSIGIIVGCFIGGIVGYIGERINVGTIVSPLISPLIGKALQIPLTIPASTSLALTIGIVIGGSLGIIVGIVGGFIQGVEIGTKDPDVEKIPWGIIFWGVVLILVLGTFGWIFEGSDGLSLGLLAGFSYFAGYLLAYYSLPFYLVDALSMVWIYLKGIYPKLMTSESTYNLRSMLSTIQKRLGSISDVPKGRQNSSEIINALHNSWFYWDNLVSLPLPLLREILLIIAEEDIGKALGEIDFIAIERPSQIIAAKKSLLEIAIKMLEVPKKTLLDIAELFQPFNDFLTTRESFLDQKWIDRFTHIRRACQNASDYFIAVSGSQARMDDLINMKTELGEVKFTEISKKSSSAKPSYNLELQTRLTKVIEGWSNIVQHEFNRLEQEHQRNKQIDNPYVVGTALSKLGTTLFVGRRDLAQQLERALEKGIHRSTFFLYGERRMGKSSTLKQLPVLLSKHYLPIFFDLENPGILSSALAFLSSVADEIYKEMNTGGIQVDRLQDERLEEASRQNEAATYYVFDKWLDGVESVLEQKNRTLILTFDEFEGLGDITTSTSLNLDFLLGWLRSVIQYRSRIALLFSGLHTLSEMKFETGVNWTRYFVNVQALKVSFLKAPEAYQLITQPVPNFPGDRIFSGEVVNEIIRVTGCHPFLVQAVCSALVDNLNIDKRNQVELVDVTRVVAQLFDTWKAFFQNLWERTDQNQRLCLVALNNLSKGDFKQIMEQSKFGQETEKITLEDIRSALQTLHKEKQKSHFLLK